MIIDYTYFNGLINIPNVDKQEVQQSLNFFVANIETDLLCSLFGYELFKAFNTGLAILPNPEQRMLNLKNGTEYTYYGRLYKWKGLAYLEGTKKFSLIANYVYFHYANNKITTSSGIGEVKPNVDNATIVSSNNKSILAYNNFVNECRELYQFLEANRLVYPEWNYQYWSNANRHINSLGI